MTAPKRQNKMAQLKAALTEIGPYSVSELVFDKETRGTVNYGAFGQKLRNVYVPKETLEEFGDSVPKKILVVVIPLD
ncbi:MAG TPA: hypothetical protein VIY48_14065 [Candidatus Paceibacterota bacterium]